jgi:pteridine reductase
MHKVHERQLTSKVALITGAARRVGAEIARYLHRAGMNVVLHYNASEQEALKLCNEFNETRANSAVSIQADLQSIDAVNIITQAKDAWKRLDVLVNNAQAKDAWKRLDVLVNNASRYYRTPLGKISDYAWEDLMNSNLRAPFFLSQAAGPYLSREHGCIINIADIQANCPLKDYPVYCISKGALITMTKVLAKELGPNVRVNAVSPGTVLWPEGENILSDVEKQKMINRSALSREGSPHDIAQTVLFLVRDADYINGQVINVDGGRFGEYEC